MLWGEVLQALEVLADKQNPVGIHSTARSKCAGRLLHVLPDTNNPIAMAQGLNYRDLIYISSFHILCALRSFFAPTMWECLCLNEQLCGNQIYIQI